MTSFEERRAALRERIDGRELLIAPGAYDAFGAILIERAGFEAMYLTGSGVAYAHGLPDVGLISLDEMAHRAAVINAVIDIPMIADGDTGYGGVLNLRRTVQHYERAGVAAIQIEDQTFPKKCGHYLGREVIPAEEMVLKIEAIREARTDPNFLIVARTDARTTHGLDEALRRGKIYAGAGAEVVFVESPENEAEMARVGAEIRTATLANMVEGGRTPLLTRRELEDLGFAVAIYPNAVTRTVAFAVGEMLAELHDTGTTRYRLDKMTHFRELNDLVDVSEAFEWEARFSPEGHATGAIEP